MVMVPAAWIMFRNSNPTAEGTEISQPARHFGKSPSKGSLTALGNRLVRRDRSARHRNWALDWN
jgi:hypothetical protein